MQSAKHILFLSIALQFSLTTMLLASFATRAAAAASIWPLEESVVSAELPSVAGTPKEKQYPKKSTPHYHHGRRRLELSLDSGDNNDDDDEVTVKSRPRTKSSAPKTNSTRTTTAQKQSELCTPMAECELCPRNWRVSNERDEEKIKGEFSTCEKYGRRRQFECTVLFQETESSEKVAQSHSEYRSCKYTEGDEQYRMFRMQMICLLIGVWAMRNVRRQKVVSASLFDQRRMRLQNANNGSSNTGSSGIMSSSSATKRYNRKDSGRHDSMETIELIPPTIGPGKVPKSPAPMPNPNLQTV